MPSAIVSNAHDAGPRAPHRATQTFFLANPPSQTHPAQVDPFIADVGSPSWQALQPHQAAAVTKAAETLKIALLTE